MYMYLCLKLKNAGCKSSQTLITWSAQATNVIINIITIT